MTRMPRVTAAELLCALHRDGWSEARSRGSHIQLTHPTKAGRITVPMHTAKVIPPAVLTSILKQAGLTTAELQRLLGRGG